MILQAYAEQAGARRYDSSYAPKKNENGSEALTYWGPAGKIEVAVVEIRDGAITTLRTGRT